MKILSFRARTMADAMERVRRDLGPQAMILQVRSVRDGPVWAFWRPRLLEVTAAAEEVAPTPPLAHLEQLLQRLMERLPAPEPESLSALAVLGLSATAIAAIQERLPTPTAADPSREDLRLAIERLLGLPLPVGVSSSESGPRVVALVGVTGVGKTTTVAKLAAHFALAEHLAVGLVTTDTYRIGAIDQLRTYAQILGVPLQVIGQEQAVPEAKARFADRDIVLLDTTGRNHQNAMAMAELRRWLEALKPDETHLVLSLATRTDEALRQLSVFMELGVNRVLYTKLDECRLPTLPIEVAARATLPASYVTTGQRVPEDIDLAAAPLLTRHILQAVPHPGGDSPASPKGGWMR